MSAIIGAGGWFLKSTAGRIIIGVAAFLIWLQFHDARVERRATEACNAEHARRAEIERQRQSDAIFQAGIEAEKRQAAEDQRLAKMALEAMTSDEERKQTARIACGVPDAAVRRMRNIK